MATSETLRVPAEWHVQRDRKPLISIAVIGVGVLFVVSVGIGAAATGSPELLPRSFLLGAFLTTVALHLHATRIRNRHRESDIALTTFRGARATELRYSRTQHLLL